MTIGEMRAEEANATPAPWYADDAITGDGSVVMSEAKGFRVAHLPKTSNVLNDVADATLIVTMRNSYDALLDVTEKAKYLADAAEWMSFHPNDKNGWADLDRTRAELRDALARLESK